MEASATWIAASLRSQAAASPPAAAAAKESLCASFEESRARLSCNRASLTAGEAAFEQKASFPCRRRRAKQCYKNGTYNEMRTFRGQLMTDGNFCRSVVTHEGAFIFSSCMMHTSNLFGKINPYFDRLQHCTVKNFKVVIIMMCEHYLCAHALLAHLPELWVLRWC